VVDGNGSYRGMIASETGCFVGYDSSDLSASGVEKLEGQDVVLEILFSATDMAPAGLSQRAELHQSQTVRDGNQIQ
jgi:hypothetical protein